MKINVKPLETIKFVFEDGKEMKCRLSIRAYTLLVDESLGNIEDIFANIQKDPYGAIAKLIYVGCKACGEEITLEMAEILAESMTVNQLIEFANKARETIESIDTEKKTMTTKKMKTGKTKTNQ